MTRYDAMEHLEVIKAFANGKDIQMLLGAEWLDVNEPAFSKLSTYRVKPKCEYVPFDFSDGQKILLKIVSKGCPKFIGIISGLDDDGILIAGNVFVTYEDLLMDWKFSDGSPCGKLKS